MMRNLALLLLLLVGLIFSENRLPAASASLFTYQGRLSQGGAGVDGKYDLTFSLYDLAAGGVQLGTTVTNLAADVTNGLFTVALDFGSAVFEGGMPWLEVGVRTNNPADLFEILKPRQLVTASPQAIYSSKAGVATSASIANTVAAGAISNANLQASAVTSDKIADGTIVNADINGTTGINGSKIIGGDLSAGRLKVGLGHTLSGVQATIAGGLNNTASGLQSSVAGGAANVASNAYAVVGGGINNVAGGPGAFVGGGGYDGVTQNGNTALGAASVVAGGTQNIASGSRSAVGGGHNNFATNLYSTVPGGAWNNASGEGSFAAGRAAKALHDGTFVWSDDWYPDFASTAAHQFLIRASGGVGIGTTDTAGSALSVAGTIRATGFSGNGGGLTNISVADASITSSKLAPGAAAANLSAGGQSGVPSGGIILSTNANDANLISAGYVKLGRVELDTAWEQASTASVPTARYWHSAVWTGKEMIVWGGYADGASGLSDGGRYNPTTNRWTALPSSGLSGRFRHTAVWTGTEMIIWGGVEVGGILYNNGARYNPTANSWTAVTTTGAPSARESHSAIWTGTEMIIWGGGGASGVLNDGGRYNPTANTWSSVSTNGAPTVRELQTAIWTGTNMIVWGGWGNGYLNNGGRYNPAANTWVAISGGLSGRDYHTAVWTGTAMLIWGGYDGNQGLGTGAIYNPAQMTWTSMNSTGSPIARYGHTAVWTGTEMIIWGGSVSSLITVNDGARYNFAANTWTPISMVGGPADRYLHTAVWTGTQMVTWGGSARGPLNDTYRYMPGSSIYIYQRL